MAEQNLGKELKKALECLEEDTLTSYVSRSRTYQSIGNILSSYNDIDPTTARRLLTICIQDLKEDMKYAVNTLNVINLVLKKIKSKKNMTIPEVAQSAVAILGIIKTTALMCKVQALPTLCFDTFLSYPDETYVDLATKYREEVMELFSLYFLRSISVILQVMPFNVLLKMLKILSPKKKRDFVEKGVPIWFSHLIPTVMHLMSQNQVIPSTLETLEILTEVLKDVDYSGNNEWKALMENVYSVDKYPAVMKVLLENGNNNWYRLWIVFVKLLKDQITTSKSKLGSPINSLLPVVEMAFKMDIPNRVRAFQCWMVLTDNFSSESQDQFVTKRIKLLIIPLKSNNAKVEDTAIAKFDTWWNVIRKFRPRIYKLIDIVFMPFLTFCFGSLKNVKDIGTAPGQLSWKLKKLCVQAFVESVGHAGCDGCVASTFPRLSEPILNHKLFVGYFTEWLGVLSVVVTGCASEEYGSGAALSVSCVWKSFILTADKCPEADKHRLLDDLLNVLGEMVEENSTNENVTKIIVDGLIKATFDNAVLTIIGQTADRLEKIIRIALEPLTFCARNNMLTTNSVRPLADAIVANSFVSSQTLVNAVLEQLPSNDAGLVIWAHIMDTMCEVDCDDSKKLKKLLMWPLANIEHFENDNYSTSIWNAAYTKYWPQLQTAGIDNDISIVLLSKVKAASSTNLLSTHALLQVLNKVLKKDSSSSCKMEAELLVKLLDKVENLESILTVVPVVVDSLLLMMNRAIDSEDTFLIESTLSAANSMIKFMRLETGDSDIDKMCMEYTEQILTQIDKCFKNSSYIKFKFLVVDQLISCLNTDKAPLKDLACCILKQILSKSDKSEVSFCLMVENALNVSEKVMEKAVVAEDANFAAPLKTKNKKKQPKIVNKTVENGEEYVVVKSNWKFNPKKLTEQQKERLQRKREDIPALYQDLSQSQDEFKMTSWKTDSQDTSTTNSKSNRAIEDSSDILKKMSSTEVVPQIMESIFSTEKIVKENGKKKFDKVLTPSPKKVKSPRVALKDRVFQNVKNLIEKSTVSPEAQKKPERNIRKINVEDKTKQETVETIASVGLNKTVAALATPSPNKLTRKRRNELQITAIYSAPSALTLERPSRVKRKPTKFTNDFQAANSKKRRSSLSSNDSQDKPLAQYIQEPKLRKSKVPQETVDPPIEVTTVATVHEEPNNQFSVDDPKPIEIQKITPAEINKQPTDSPKKVPIVVLEQTTPEKLKEAMTQVAALAETKNLFCTKINVPEKEAITLEGESENQKIESPSASPKAEPKKIPVIVLKQTTPENIVITTSPSPSKQTEKVKLNKQSNKKPRIQRQLVHEMIETVPKPELNDVINVRNEESNKCNEVNKESNSTTSDICENDDNDATQENVIKPIVKPEKANSSKKNVKRKSRIHTELGLNVTGAHSILPDSQPGKRVTRKSALGAEAVSTSKKKSVTQKLTKAKNISKSDSKVAKRTAVVINNIDAKDNLVKELFTAKDTEDNCTSSTDDAPFSEDFIESSQDSSSISVNSHRSMIRKAKVVLEQNKSIDILTANHMTKDDIEFSQNKSVEQESDMTAILDTEPMDADMDNKEDSSELIILTIEPNSPTVTTQQSISIDSQDTANADTQLMDPNRFIDDNVIEILTPTQETQAIPYVQLELLRMDKPCTPEPETDSEAGVSSPFKDKEERNKDFLNNTLEISPIRTMSPAPIDKGSPETSNDYVLVTLSSPVHSNGEPYDKSGSPEIFTDDKMSGDNDGAAGSPSLSLKKKPQVRPSGRGAQMLGLCVPDHLQTLVTERADAEEARKPGPSAAPARRNLRIMINCAEREEREDSESFLQLRKNLPPADCSPAGPILKRKLADLCDDAVVSPASKRKRVSFHDPPVSTTVSVHKYIEPLGVRSPQTGAKKAERQTRPSVVKSSKKLDTMFKLDTVLTRAVESFADPNEDTEMSSMEQTPAVEIVKTSELNDVDPICPELIFCMDPISNIATELSSPVMRAALIAELEGKVDTVGDLAKLTELEVNRLRIKAPKVDVAKRVLADYASNLIESLDETSMTRTAEVVTASSEMQTEALELRHSDAQTDVLDVSAVDTQTDEVVVAHRSVQTNESGSSTKDVIESCLKERSNFVEELSVTLEDSAKVKIASGLSVRDICGAIDRSSLKTVDAQRLLDTALASAGKAKSLEYLQQYIVDAYSTNDIILFCSDLLRKVHGESTK